MKNQKHPWKDPLSEYQKIEKTGEEHLRNGPKEFPQDLLSFWQWAGSDIVVNIWRGVLAEYIVSLAAGCEQTTRVEWGSYDLITPKPDCIKIEVKSSSFLQSWSQKNLSAISFGIAETKGWDAYTNEYSEKKQRHADIYVFCVLKHKDKNTIDPLNMEQWEFYVLPTNILNRKFKDSKKIGLSVLQGLQPKPYTFDELGARIKEIGLKSKRR